MEYVKDLWASWSDHGEWLPITAWVALGVFVLREVLEWRRRRAADARKVQALKKVIARECELNYWSVDQLSDTLSEMRKIGAEKDASRFTLTTRAAGEVVVQLSDEDGSGHGWMLPRICTETLTKHLAEVAALDEEFFTVCEAAVGATAEADHIHRSLVQGPPAHFPSSRENYYEGLIGYGLKELQGVVAAIKALYLACTGTELTHGRLR